MASIIDTQTFTLTRADLLEHFDIPPRETSLYFHDGSEARKDFEELASEYAYDAYFAESGESVTNTYLELKCEWPQENTVSVTVMAFRFVTGVGLV